MHRKATPHGITWLFLKKSNFNSREEENIMKKGFKEQAARPSVYAEISGTQATEGAQDTRDIQAAEDRKKREYYRFNLKMPIEYKEYLQSAAYKASSPGNMVTITEYICNLIKDDMDKNGQ